MKIFKSMKNTLFLLVLLTSIIQANFILKDELLLEKTSQKIQTIGQELFEKTNISVFLITKENEDILTYPKTLVPQDKDYVIFSLIPPKVDIQADPKTLKLINKDKILNKFVIPILIAKSKNSDNSTYSAAMLNGYSQIAEDIAAKNNIELNSTIGSGSSDTFSFIRAFIYLFCGITILTLLYTRLRK